MSTQDPGRHGGHGEYSAPGSVIGGKYEVERVLGSGGMGVVLAARHIELRQRVAIKLMRTTGAEDPTAVTRFLREARAAVALSSDHATKVLDVGTLPSGAPYMVMEYLAGVDLAEVLSRGGPMAIADAVDAVLQACEALAEAHGRGIVHRDLKPSNLFVTRRIDGAAFVKVLDFGISKNTGPSGPIDESGSLTDTGLTMGSPGYMSPEQVRNAKTVDARSDIWSLGVILYQTLTGISPFVGETLGDTFARIVSEDPAPIRGHRPEVPEGLAAAIAQCLERRLDRRVPTVAQLAERLAPFGGPDAALAAKRVLRISRSASGQEPMSLPTPAPGQGGSRELAATASATQSANEVSRPAGPWQQFGAGKRAGRATPHAAWVSALVAAGALILVAGAAGVRALRGAPHVGSLEVPTVASSPLGDVPPVSAPPAPVPKPPESAPSAQPQPTADAGAGLAPPRPPRPPPPSPQPRPTHSGDAKRACVQNFYLDDQGNKHFKPECF
jgi:eukaryotic-like serine/threonine-protein kinase